MAELPIDQSIPRFKTNEDRFDNFVNGSPTGGYVTSGGTSVPSLRKFLAQKSDYVDTQTADFLSQKNAEINTAANGILAQANGAKGAALIAQEDAENAQEAAETAQEAAETAKTQVDGLLILVNNAKDEAIAVTKHYFGARTTAPTVEDDGVVLGDEYLDVAVTPNQRMTYTASGWRQVSPVALAGYRRQDWTATANETGPFEVDGGFSSGDVYVNGTLRQAGVTLTPGDQGSFTFAAGLTAGDKVAFRGYMTGADADFYTKGETDAALGALGFRVGTNESDIESLEAAVSDNTDALTALSGRIGTNENDIQSLATTVSNNTDTLATLGDAATKNVGTAADTVAAGNDPRFAEILTRGVPLGTMVHSAVPLESQGFLLADGSPCTPTTPDLRAALLAADSPFGHNGVDPLLPDEMTGNRFRRAAGGALALGTVQADAFQGHGHEVRSGAVTTGSNKAGPSATTSAWHDAKTNPGADVWTFAGLDAFDTGYGTPRVANETRPKSIAYLPYIKAFGAITIEGMADLSALFAAVATKSDAEAGADNTKLMTALRTKEAIDARKGTTGALALSGAQFDVTGIPTVARRVKLKLAEVSLSAGVAMYIQLGTAAGMETTGYKISTPGRSTSGTNTSTSTAAIVIALYSTATGPYSGIVELERVGNTNNWIATSLVKLADSAGAVGDSVGFKAMTGGALDRLRITTAAGTATLSGSIEVEWEK